jgi:hypothetical protein|tara:strand:- start:279 stop:404 length:126 start_codon:yes stop_codon:yes gene_type:complete
VNLIEDVPTGFFENFYLTICEYFDVDPDALLIQLMEEENNE